MKILVAIPGNLRTVSMGRFVPDALAALGEDVRVVDYSPTLVEKLRHKLFRHEVPEAVTPRLLAAIEAHSPQLFITLFGVNVGPNTARASTNNVTTSTPNELAISTALAARGCSCSQRFQPPVITCRWS